MTDPRSPKQKRDHWKQDTPREQMVALTQAIAGYAAVAEDLEWTPERVQRVFQSIGKRCDDLFELSKWVDAPWGENFLIMAAEVAVGALEVNEKAFELYEAEHRLDESHMAVAKSVAGQFTNGLTLLKAVLEEAKKRQ